MGEGRQDEEERQFLALSQVWGLELGFGTVCWSPWDWEEKDVVWEC